MLRKLSSLHKSSGITLVHLILGIAIALLLGLGVATLWNAFKTTTGLGTTPVGGAAATQFTWVTIPTNNEFQKNTDALYVVRLERYNGAAQSFQAFANQNSLAGAVVPASVSVVSINGSAPSSPTSIPSGSSVAPGGGNLYKTTSKTNGTISITLRGTEAADGSLTVIYVRSATQVTQSTKTFSVTD